jgi:hypothetical protein
VRLSLSALGVLAIREREERVSLLRLERYLFLYRERERERERVKRLKNIYIFTRGIVKLIGAYFYKIILILL